MTHHDLFWLVKILNAQVMTRWLWHVNSIRQLRSRLLSNRMDWTVKGPQTILVSSNRSWPLCWRPLNSRLTHTFTLTAGDKIKLILEHVCHLFRPPRNGFHYKFLIVTVATFSRFFGGHEIQGHCFLPPLQSRFILYDPRKRFLSPCQLLHVI